MNIHRNFYLLLLFFIIADDFFVMDYKLKKIFVKTSFKIVLFIFFLLIIPFTLVDYYKINPFYKYKVEKHRNELTFDLLYETFKLTIFNLLLIPVVSILLFPYVKITDQFSYYHIFLLISLIIIEEIGFYTTHRILHIPFFYKHIHKVHHKWIYPIALSCIYAHPVEFIFSNLLPTIIAMLSFSYFNIYISIYIYWLWMIIGFTNTVWVHAGYSSKNEKQYLPHFYHHISFSNNYGISIFMDKLFGTYKTSDRGDLKKLF